MELHKKVGLIVVLTAVGFAFPWALFTLYVAFVASFASAEGVPEKLIAWVYSLPMIAGGTFGVLCLAWSTFFVFFLAPANDWYGYKRGDRLVWLRGSDN